MQSTTTFSNYATLEELTINGAYRPAFQHMLSPGAQEFLLQLHRRFNPIRLRLLQHRKERQASIDAGSMPDFLPETQDIRKGKWKVAPLPKDLLNRRVEITGPVDRKMVINALNSGANVYMADFEDSHSPGWENTLQGQINLYDAIRRTISFYDARKDKTYQLKDEVATLMVRPRGWHLEEKHILCDGEPMSGSLVDFGLYFFHNAKVLRAIGTGPYFYLPKLENHMEAKLWNEVFVFAQDYLGIPQKSIKATVLIETILASFELDEILFELKDHSAGLNCGRWDYIFSYIKKFRNLPGFVMPDRAQITMNTPFMKAYAQLVVQTCHRRGVHAMGGMAAQIPIKNDAAANEKALQKVKLDKLREVNEGHDGTWVAHPGLVETARSVFDENMPGDHQIHQLREEVKVTAGDLLAVPEGTITEQGLRTNINVGILYIESWLRGNGAAAIYHLMEDAATAEISRTQVWQWLQNKALLEDGRTITLGLYQQLLEEEMEKIKAYVGEDLFEGGRFEEALGLFDRLVRSPQYIEFLTLPAYDLID